MNTWIGGAVLLACTAIYNLRERRYAMAAFWLILGLPFAVGDAQWLVLAES